MSETVKLIIEIPKIPKNDHERWVLAHGTLLDTVKAEIEKHKKPVRIPYEKDYFSVLWAFDKAIEILDSISKESEGIRNNESPSMEKEFQKDSRKKSLFERG